LKGPIPFHLLDRERFSFEITGSHGCYRDQLYEMLYRDAKALLIAGGSSEIMKIVIADFAIGKQCERIKAYRVPKGRTLGAAGRLLES
jgi:hypothetical protein